MKRPTSRKATPWNETENMTETQHFLKQIYETRYAERHIPVKDSGESALVNSFVPSKCPHCTSEDFKRRGLTSSGVQRYKCVCGKSFIPTTGTIFDEHRISISEWMEYCLNLFRHVSITADSYSQTIKPRLEKLGADFTKIFFVDEEDEALTFSDNRIEQTILTKNAKLILLDPVQAYFGKANMNAAGSVRPVLKQLGAVAQRTGCAVVIVGHLNKNGSGKATYRGLGSIDIFATARSVMTVGKTDADRFLRIMVHNKSNLAPAGPPQSFGLGRGL